MGLGITVTLYMLSWVPHWRRPCWKILYQCNKALLALGIFQTDLQASAVFSLSTTDLLVIFCQVHRGTQGMCRAQLGTCTQLSDSAVSCSYKTGRYLSEIFFLQNGQMHFWDLDVNWEPLLFHFAASLSATWILPFSSLNHIKLPRSSALMLKIYLIKEDHRIQETGLYSPNCPDFF